VAGSVVKMADMNDFNRVLTSEFRANGGKVGGQFENIPAVLRLVRN